MQTNVSKGFGIEKKVFNIAFQDFELKGNRARKKYKSGKKKTKNNSENFIGVNIGVTFYKE